MCHGLPESSSDPSGRRLDLDHILGGESRIRWRDAMPGTEARVQKPPVSQEIPRNERVDPFVNDGIDGLSTIWLALPAVLCSVVFVATVIPEIEGLLKRLAFIFVPIAPLVWVLGVEGVKGHSVHHALVLYSDTMVVAAVVGFRLRNFALRMRRQGITVDNGLREAARRESKVCLVILAVVAPILLLVEYGPFISW
jgi:hypothetical protein